MFVVCKNRSHHGHITWHRYYPRLRSYISVHKLRDLSLVPWFPQAGVMERVVKEGGVGLGGGGCSVWPDTPLLPAVMHKRSQSQSSREKAVKIMRRRDLQKELSLSLLIGLSPLCVPWIRFMLFIWAIIWHFLHSPLTHTTPCLTHFYSLCKIGGFALSLKWSEFKKCCREMHCKLIKPTNIYYVARARPGTQEGKSCQMVMLCHLILGKPCRFGVQELYTKLKAHVWPQIWKARYYGSRSNLSMHPCVIFSVLTSHSSM